MSLTADNSIDTPLPLSITPTPSRIPTPLPSLRADERQIKGKLWRRIGYQSVYRNSAGSSVWLHGDIYARQTRPTDPPHWICDYCNSILKPQRSRSTTNFRRHLKDKHKIGFESEADGVEEQGNEEEVDTAEEPPRQYSALYTTVNSERFRILLLRLFIYCQLPYSLIERQEFRDLLLYIQPSIDKYLITRNTIGNWIQDEFTKGQKVIQEIISQARSRIHISFDMWTSPPGTPILGICGHFLDHNLRLIHPLLALRYLRGHHTGAAMAEVIEAVMNEYGIADKWGVCVADNADNCDTCIAALVNSLRPGEELTARRSRCFGHIVNLAAKAFIYGKKAEGFILEAEQMITLSNRDQAAVQQEMKLWRSRGSFGKFHNIVKHIKGTSLRRQKLEAIIMAVGRQVGHNITVGGGVGVGK